MDGPYRTPGAPTRDLPDDLWRCERCAQVYSVLAVIARLGEEIVCVKCYEASRSPEEK